MDPRSDIMFIQGEDQQDGKVVEDRSGRATEEQAAKANKGCGGSREELYELEAHVAKIEIAWRMS